VVLFFVVVWVAAAEFHRPAPDRKDPVKTDDEAGRRRGYVNKAWSRWPKNLRTKFVLEPNRSYLVHDVSQRHVATGFRTIHLANYPRSVSKGSCPGDRLVGPCSSASRYCSLRYRYISWRGYGVAAIAALLRYLLPPLLTLSAIPAYYLLGLVLVAGLLAFRGGHITGPRRLHAGTLPDLSQRFFLDAARPRDSSWPIRYPRGDPVLGAGDARDDGDDSGRRLDDDLCRSKGAQDQACSSAMRCATLLLPQATALALALGEENLSGAVLVEVIICLSRHRVSSLRRSGFDYF